MLFGDKNWWRISRILLHFVIVYCFAPLIYLFLFAVFNAMVNLVEYRSAMATVWFTLASCTRSNGVVNIFFVAYYQLRLIVNKINTAKGYPIKEICISFACTASSCLSILVPFVGVNAYGYSRFCHSSESSVVPIWKQISNCSTLPEFCCSALPLIYQHVQKHHWQLGFLSYYQFRKLPNFILATPIVCTVLYGTIKYMTARKHEIFNLGLLSYDCSVRVDTKYAFASRNIFCFAVNAFVLITFSLLFMHVDDVIIDLHTKFQTSIVSTGRDIRISGSRYSERFFDTFRSDIVKTASTVFEALELSFPMVPTILKNSNHSQRYEF